MISENVTYCGIDEGLLDSVAWKAIVHLWKSVCVHWRQRKRMHQCVCWGHNSQRENRRLRIQVDRQFRLRLCLSSTRRSLGSPSQVPMMCTWRTSNGKLDVTRTWRNSSTILALNDMFHNKILARSLTFSNTSLVSSVRSNVINMFSELSDWPSPSPPSGCTEVNNVSVDLTTWSAASRGYNRQVTNENRQINEHVNDFNLTFSVWRVAKPGVEKSTPNHWKKYINPKPQKEDGELVQKILQ